MKVRPLISLALITSAITGCSYLDPTGLFPQPKKLPGVMLATIYDPQAKSDSLYAYTGKASAPFMFVNKQAEFVKKQADKSSLPNIRTTIPQSDFSPDKKWWRCRTKRPRKACVTNGDKVHTFKTSGLDLSIAWSPDSRYVAYGMFLENRLNSAGLTYVLDLKNGRRTLISKNLYWPADWYTNEEFQAITLANKTHI